MLKSRTGEWKPILSIERVQETANTYNFEVEKNHDYFVGENGWLVHNQSLTSRARFEVGPNGVAIPTSKTELVDSLTNAGFQSYQNTRNVTETGVNFINPSNGNIYRIMDGSSVNPPRLITHFGAGKGPITPWGAPIPPGLKGNAVRDITHFLLEP